MKLLKPKTKIMPYVNKIFKYVSMVFYVFALYELWHLCQFGGVQRHFQRVVIGIAGCVFTFILWLVTRKYRQKADLESTSRKKLFHIQVGIFLIVTLFFGGRIVYSAVPYHGALSWKVDEMMRKKEIPLEHNNIYETGVEGILSDLKEKLELPDKLYIANKFQVRFDETGDIQSIYAFLYGKNEKGSEKTYLVDYDAKSSNSMKVWVDGNANGGYEDDMSLSPMLKILDNADWINQVKSWSENFEKKQVYELLYLGRRAFGSADGLCYIPGDADGDGVVDGDGNFLRLDNGGEIVGFEVSLHIPAEESVTPVRYIMEPLYVSQGELAQENTTKQVEEAKEAQRWTTDNSDGTMYFFLDEQRGWRLVVTDAAAGSRYYELEMSADGGDTWERINTNPFDGQMGAAEGILFFNGSFGVIGLAGASSSHSELYITRDGGGTFEEIELPMDTVTKLPQLAYECEFTAADYDYLNMPEKDGDVFSIIVTTQAGESEGIVFKSTDEGLTWEYNGITQ